ncbi:uncharacterized protein G2W53_028409 [Senna tora]|uniref:Uncharacterized protein n=1 Tax=Senna tora TaxID=362788 RepID=A0A834T4E2_9FABA|nr:uncharacterized protein G2W53_028409 [Senna tora]
MRKHLSLHERIDLFVENVDFGNINNFEENDVFTVVGALNLNLTITNPCPKYSLHFHRFEVHLISLEDATFAMANYVPSSSSFEIGKNDGVSVEIIFNSSTSRMPAQEWSRFQRHKKNGSKLVLFGDSTLMPLQLGVDVRALLTLRGERDELAWIRASCGSLNDIIINVNNNNNGTAKLCHSSFIQ